MLAFGIDADRISTRGHPSGSAVATECNATTELAGNDWQETGVRTTEATTVKRAK